jgi:hypothetical protein
VVIQASPISGSPILAGDAELVRQYGAEIDRLGARIRCLAADEFRANDFCLASIDACMEA